MTSVTATEARRNLYRLIDEVFDSHVPIHITGKRHSGVLLSEEDWNAIQETLYLQSIPGMGKSIQEGMNSPVSKCSKDPGW